MEVPIRRSVSVGSGTLVMVVIEGVPPYPYGLRYYMVGIRDQTVSGWRMTLLLALELEEKGSQAATTMYGTP